MSSTGENNLTQPSQQTPPNPSDFNTSNVGKRILILLSILAVISGIAYISYMYGKSKNLKSPAEKNQIKEIPSPQNQDNSSLLPANWATYTNQTYNFSLSYPQDWEIKEPVSPTEDDIKFSQGQHEILIRVWPVTDFGQCFKYETPRKINIDGVQAETADGTPADLSDIFSPEEDPCKDKKGKGNTYILIPVQDENQKNTKPPLMIHISYTYPLKDKEKAKATLDKLLASFKFFKKPTPKLSPQKDSEKDLGWVRTDFFGYGLSIEYPKGWHVASYNPNGNFSKTLLLINPEPILVSTPHGPDSQIIISFEYVFNNPKEVLQQAYDEEKSRLKDIKEETISTPYFKNIKHLRGIVAEEGMDQGREVNKYYLLFPEDKSDDEADTVFVIISGTPSPTLENIVRSLKPNIP